MLDFILKYWLEFLFGGMLTGLSLLYQRLSRRVKRQDAIGLGVQALLRDRIIQIYNHYAEAGYLPIYARENIEALYKQYHALGGNGTITELIEKLHDLPTEK